MEKETIKNGVDKFVAILNERKSGYAKTHYPRLFEMNSYGQLEVATAKKYYKVWESRHGRRESIHSFINIETGEIFMPAGRNAPAKHARGNVLSNTNGMEAVDERGTIIYLR